MTTTTNPYGTTRAARVMLEQDRQANLLTGLIRHLTANPIEDVFVHADTLKMLFELDRRKR